MKAITSPFKLKISGLLLLAGVFAALNVQAANVTKLNTTTMVNGVSDWSAAPATTDVGEFNNVPTLANMAAMTLGGDLTLGGLQLDNNITGPLTIATGNTLTLGTSGINMSAANNNLTFNCAMALGGGQAWNIVSGRTVTLSGATTIANGANNMTVNGGGTVSVTFPNTASISAGQGAGTWTFNGSTLSCNIPVGTGTFVNLVNFLGTASSTLTMAGSTMNMNEASSSGTHSQTFATLTLNPGLSTFAIVGRGSSSQFQTKFSALPTRNAGSVVNFPAVNSSSFVGIGGTAGTTMGYGTYNSSDFVKNGASSAATVAAVTYVNDTWAAGNNTTVTTSSSPAANATTGTLRFGAVGAFSVTLSGANTNSSGGILVNGIVAGNASTITGGSLTSGNTTADGFHDLIVINNNSTAGGNLVINSAIVDNGANAVGLTKTGAGTLILGGANTFTGPSYIVVVQCN